MTAADIRPLLPCTSARNTTTALACPVAMAAAAKPNVAAMPPPPPPQTWVFSSRSLGSEVGHQADRLVVVVAVADEAIDIGRIEARILAGVHDGPDQNALLRHRRGAAFVLPDAQTRDRDRSAKWLPAHDDRPPATVDAVAASPMMFPAQGGDGFALECGVYDLADDRLADPDLNRQGSAIVPNKRRRPAPSKLDHVAMTSGSPNSGGEPNWCQVRVQAKMLPFGLDGFPVEFPGAAFAAAPHGRDMPLPAARALLDFQDALLEAGPVFLVCPQTSHSDPLLSGPRRPAAPHSIKPLSRPGIVGCDDCAALSGRHHLVARSFGRAHADNPE